MEEDMITLPLEIKEDSLIKVVGVGGGGGNAVDYMYLNHLYVHMVSIHFQRCM